MLPIASPMNLRLIKKHSRTSAWSPFETGRAETASKTPVEIIVADARLRPYARGTARAGKPFAFTVRGALGCHTVFAGGEPEARFQVDTQTGIDCDRGIYARLATRLRNLMSYLSERRSHIISGRLYELLVCWFRDHVHVLKSHKYHVPDVKSGAEFFWDRQQPNGMIWDDVHANPAAPQPTVFGEALGTGFHAYEEDRKWVLRRIPCEADVEYLAIEGLYHAWKASGDDAWLAARMPAAEKALAYMTRDPLRWSARNGLVKRAYTMDSWDFTNPHFYTGDHRLAPKNGPWFHLHSDNSGCYSALWRMAEMYEALGNTARAAALRKRAGAFRANANARLFKGDGYAHMVPEKPMPGLKALVGDDDRRLSLSMGYTINRGLPTHEMAVRILKEYQRRRKAQAGSSFAEWWSMDPPYTPSQWPVPNLQRGMPAGEYMNGCVSPITAGELAHAAFQHGMESYGADILRRLWNLTERDGGWLNDAYRRLPPNYRFKNPGRFTPLDLQAAANRGLQHKAARGVPAWTDEGDNDLRNLPTGARTFAGAAFRVIQPAANAGRAVIGLSRNPARKLPESAEIPAGGRKAASVWFLHATGSSGKGVVATYDLLYDDGTEHRAHITAGVEIGHWWGPAPLGGERPPFHVARIGWRGENPTFGNVGVYVHALDNPHPDRPIRAIRLTATSGAMVMVCAASLSTAKAEFDLGIRSYGAPANWAQSSCYYAVAEGLAGITDPSRAFQRARIAPRWAATEAANAACTLHYPASRGYAAYRFALDRRRKRILLDITGGFDSADVSCLLPAGARARSVSQGGKPVPFTHRRVEKSVYCEFALDGLPEAPVIIQF